MWPRSPAREDDSITTAEVLPHIGRSERLGSPDQPQDGGCLTIADFEGQPTIFAKIVWRLFDDSLVIAETVRPAVDGLERLVGGNLRR
jgi:hypothetical protein